MRDHRRGGFWDDRAPGNGSASVEFAIAFPLQLLITFGIMQLILIAVATLMVNYAAQVAARAAVVGEDPARAAAIVLSPLAGLHRAATRNSHISGGIAIPGWGTLRGSALALEKVHVRLNGSDYALPPRPSPFTLADPEAYEDELRFTSGALAMRDEIADAFGAGQTANVVVEFDYELLFPVVDAIYGWLYQGDGFGDGRGRRAAVFGEIDRNHVEATGHYEWTWIPGEGYQAGAARVRMIGGRHHLVIARESTLYRGFPLR